MKSLQTIQKTFRVFQILVKIGMICSFVWAGLALLGLLCCIVWKVSGAVAGSELEILHSLLTTENLTEAIGVLLTDTLFAVTDGILLIFALRYFNAEQEDGTPFTKRGADRILRLGILTIVLPFAAAITSSILRGIFSLSVESLGSRGNFDGVTIGIVLILASLIFRYGADLEEKRE